MNHGKKHIKLAIVTKKLFINEYCERIMVKVNILLHAQPIKF